MHGNIPELFIKTVIVPLVKSKGGHEILSNSITKSKVFSLAESLEMIQQLILSVWLQARSFHWHVYCNSTNIENSC